VPITLLLSLYSIFKTYKLLITKKHLTNQIQTYINDYVNDNDSTGINAASSADMLKEIDQVLASNIENPNSSGKAPSIDEIKTKKTSIFKSMSNLISEKATIDNAKIAANEIKDLTVGKVEKHVTKALNIHDYINSSKSITSFLMNQIFNTPDLPENHIILSAFSRAFWYAMNPGGSKRPLFIMYKELCRYQTNNPQ